MLLTLLSISEGTTYEKYKLAWPKLWCPKFYLLNCMYWLIFWLLELIPIFWLQGDPSNQSTCQIVLTTYFRRSLHFVTLSRRHYLFRLHSVWRNYIKTVNLNSFSKRCCELYVWTGWFLECLMSSHSKESGLKNTAIERRTLLLDIFRSMTSHNLEHWLR